jgi:hypothetical protein
MAPSLQHLMRRACSSIQSKASCLLVYEEKGRQIQPFPSLIRVQLDKDLDVDERESIFFRYPHN